MLLQDLNALTDRFTSLWTGTLPVIYDLEPEADYTDGSVQFSVVLTTSQHLFGDVRSGAKKQNGFVELTLDVPDQSGDADAYAMMEQFAAIFRNWSDNNIRCETEYLTPHYKLDSGLVRFRISVKFSSVRLYS